MIQTTVLVRNIGAVLLILIGAIGLGLAGHVYQTSKGVGYKSSALVVNIVSAAWTLGTELVLAVCRFVLPGGATTTYLFEMVVLLITTVLWLVSGDLTSQARNICGRLDDLSSRPEYSHASQSELQHASDVLSDSCSQLHADYGFIWLAFVTAILLLGFLGVQAFRMRGRGIPKILLQQISEMGHAKSKQSESQAHVAEKGLKTEAV